MIIRYFSHIVEQFYSYLCAYINDRNPNSTVSTVVQMTFLKRVFSWKYSNIKVFFFFLKRRSSCCSKSTNTHFKDNGVSFNESDVLVLLLTQGYVIYWGKCAKLFSRVVKKYNVSTTVVRILLFYNSVASMVVDQCSTI